MDLFELGSAAAGVKEFLSRYRNLYNHHLERISINRLEKCADDILKIDSEGALRIQNYAKHAQLKVGTICDIVPSDYLSNAIAYVDGTKECIVIPTGNDMMNVMQHARGIEYEDPNKCVRIKIVCKTTDPMCLSFLCKKENIKAVLIVIEDKYGKDNVTCVDSSITIKEMSDNYSDYVRKFIRLSNDPKLKMYTLTKLEIEYPKGTEVDIVKIPIDPIDWCHNPNQPMLNIYFNITNNGNTYNNCTFNNCRGNTITVSDVSKLTSVDEKNIDVDLLNWTSENPPKSGEYKSVYYRRMKSINTHHKGGRQLHNKYMIAFGWISTRKTTGQSTWVKDQV
jgi:hypothetical protein